MSVGVSSLSLGGSSCCSCCFWTVSTSISVPWKSTEEVASGLSAGSGCISVMFLGVAVGPGGEIAVAFGMLLWCLVLMGEHLSAVFCFGVILSVRPLFFERVFTLYSGVVSLFVLHKPGLVAMVKLP